MKWNVSSLSAIALLVATACGVGVQSTQTIAIPLETDTISASYAVSCVFDPSPIPRNEHVDMTLSLRRKDGAALSEGLSVKVDADMPSHGHGINTAPEIQKVTTGKYEVKGLLFHMGGEWELYIDVMEDGIPDRATIAFTL
jgi:hypothetical protein